MLDEVAKRVKSILLVEDEAIIALSQTRLLESEGFAVTSVSRGEKAVSAVRAEPEKFDLVLMDIDLGPGLDGTDAAREILKIRDLPVVFLSSHTESDVVEKTESISSYGYITKSAGITVLLTSIRMAFKLHQSHLRVAKSETAYRLLFENLTAGFAVHQMIYDEKGFPVDYRFLDMNPAFERLTGLHASDLIGKTVLDVMPGTERYWIDTYAAVARSGHPTSFRNFSKELDKYFDTWVFSPGSNQFAVVFTDISENVRSEERLAASEERFRVLFETMSQGVVFQDADGKIEMANPAAENILGLSLDQLQGRTSMDPQWRVIHEDGSDFPGSEHPISVALRTGKSTSGTTMGIYHPIEDRPRWIRVDAVPLFRDGEAKPYRVYTMFTDIGERNKVEKVQTFLAKRGWAEAGEDFFRALSRFLAEILEADYVCVDYLEGDGLSARTVAVYFDRHFEDNVSYSLKDTPCGSVVGKTICCFPRAVRDLFPKDVILQEMVAESYAGITLWSGDGRPIGLIAVIARKPLENPEFVQTVLGLVAARAAGELERRDTEQALHRLVEQKETLLKELQHRVKNNLNVISSLLDLETQGLEEERTKAVFIGARNRIQSMSAIYERLYLSEDLARVDLGPYIEDLASSIFESYNIHPGGVLLSIKADAIRLDTKRVVPLGLILNELISNTLKYAFPSGKGGTLSIGLSLVGSRLTLQVHDDGIGFPIGFDPLTTESLGFVLVCMLADEIGAELSFEGRAGVMARLSFDI